MPCEFRRRHAPETKQPEIDLIHHSNQPQSFGDFAHGAETGCTPKLTYFFSYYRSKGTSIPHYWRRGTTVRHARDHSFVRSPNRMEEAQVVPFAFHTTTPTTTSTSCSRKERQSLQSTTDDNGTPATWTLVLFQQAIDRQDRTRAEGRFSYWKYCGNPTTHWRYQYSLVYRNTPPDKDSSHDDMPCRHPLH